MDLTAEDRQALLQDIATRAGSAGQIAQWYECTIAELKQFVADNQFELTSIQNATEEDDTATDVVTPTQLDELWISQKFARLQRYQDIADRLYKSAKRMPDATNLRELRAYMLAAANELGQLLHRGSGESNTGDTLSVDIQGIDLDNLR